MRSAVVPLAALALLAAVAVPPAGAGAVEGSVTLVPEDLAIHDTSKPNPYVGQLGSAASGALQEAAQDTVFGVAWVADAVSEGGGALPSVRMDQVAQRFVPRILAIVAGQT